MVFCPRIEKAEKLLTLLALLDIIPFLTVGKNGIILDYSQGKTEVKCRQYQPDNMIGTAYFVSKNDSEHQMSHFINRLGDVFKVQIVLYIVSHIGKVLVKRKRLFSVIFA